MQILIVALWSLQCSWALGQPYVFETTWIAAQTTSITNALPSPKPSEAVLYEKRGYGEIIRARDTTATTDSTSTTETTSISETSTSTTSTTSTTSSTSSTSSASTTSTSTSDTSTSSTTSSMTPSASTTSSTSTSSSSTTTTSSSTTRTAAATATSSSTAALEAWNRKGNITAIIFGSCLISLFSGITICYCVRDRNKLRRIAARELLKTEPSYSVIPPATPKGISTPDLKMDRSSMMFTNNPQPDYFPASRSTPSMSNYHSHTPSATSQATTNQASLRENTPRSHADEQTSPLV